MHRLAIIIVGFVVVLGLGCSQPPAETATTRKAVLTGLPVEFTARQRSTTAVGQSDGRLLITIDDITRNQVMVSGATTGGATVLPLRSMAPNDAAPFTLEGQQLVLHLLRLDNAVTGEDFAAFKVSGADEAETSLTEKQKIERLIGDVAGLSGATFIRNDTEHSAEEAAKHLKAKWEGAGSKVTTARQFIDGVASKSLASGKPYQIRYADGRVIDAAEFLNERLKRLERDG